ncbi:hypothetical protein QBC39DRAFT_331428 [Podospora conica]|nr:hypothetical protein QBC39DRAFT_331428 [Schizothecium conicum]
MSHHDQVKRRSSLNPLEDVSFGEGIDLAVGLTATALTADQLVKLAHTKKHTTKHLVKGSLSAGLATAAFAMMAREHREKHEKEQQQRRRRSLQVLRSRPLSASDSDTDDGRNSRAMALARPRSRSPSRRSSSTHSTYSEHFRKQDPAHMRPLPSPAPSSRRRRALSHPPARDRTFAESHPNLIKFVEAVRDNLRDGSSHH